MSTLPDFQMDVTGEYQGNAYPESAEYRIVMLRHTTGSIMFCVENSSGSDIGQPLVLDDGLIEGITWMANTNHDLGGYQDDWDIPAGMDRQLVWTLQTDIDHYVQLTEDQIDQVAAWLRFATGEDEWTGGEVWEY
jgi:hypothetical protein